MLDTIITAVSPLAGVVIGGMISGRQTKAMIRADRRESDRKALSEFIEKSNESHTRMTEQIFESESAHTLQSGEGLSEVEKNRRTNADINKIVAFINRYLGDLRGQALLLGANTTNKGLLDALDGLFQAISRDFQKLNEIQDHYGKKAGEMIAIFQQLEAEMEQQLAAGEDCFSQSLTHRNASIIDANAQVSRNIQDYRSALLKAAIRFETNAAVVNVVEAGRSGTASPQKSAKTLKNLLPRLKKKPAPRRSES